MLINDRDLPRQYNQLAESYEKFSSANKEITYVSDPLLLELIGDIHGLDVLDVGCGNGAHLAILREKTPNSLVGVDISEKFIDICKQNLPSDVKLVVANANTEDFVAAIQSAGTGQFDVIYHSFVQVHNTTREEMKAFWRNIHQLLKKGGRAIGITSDPNAAKPLGVDKLMDLSYGFPNGAPLKDGDIFEAHLSPELTVYSHYWSFETVADLMKEIGLKDVRRASVHANDISMQAYSKKEWNVIEKSGAIYALVGVK
ncbi:MAG: class I SAM-dependent methyltransferase [Gammaproteobacteria bacterium]|nr:class I SAM-dependent methyltransferase [Gammaproteobacteria bacterium]NNJ83508.1 methyltransferase domain-containing protein [Gammaproteobacteria bacterium]